MPSRESNRLPHLIPLKTSAERVIRVLKRRGIPYVMIGAIVAGHYGEARPTEDLDFTPSPEPFSKEFPQLMEDLEGSGILLSSSRPTRHELAGIPSLRFLDTRSRAKIDLVINPKGLVWDRQFESRRKRVTLLLGLQVWIPSAEDMIIMKLASGKPLDLSDLERIIARQATRLDWEYIEQRATEVKLVEEVSELKKRFSQGV